LKIRTDKLTIEKEYARCIASLTRAGILTFLPGYRRTGITGSDGKEYPVPTREQVEKLLDNNRELANTKALQGFGRLELVPMAMPLHRLLGLLEAAVVRHAAKGQIYQTRCNASDPLVPVRVNNDKQVWVWDTLKQLTDTDELVYFPMEYSVNHRGQTKAEAAGNTRICAVQGWSVGLVEDVPVMPQPGQGQILAGRKQLETGFAPREYLETLQQEPYRGETGKTLEDFITGFLIRLEETDEVSHDRYDNNSVWCLGQYVKIEYAELVPTGWWHREMGRMRLDMHRTGNKLCTRNWGASTTVRLPGSE